MLAYYFNETSVSKTIRKPPLVKAQTALRKPKKIQYGEKRFSIWRMELLHHAMWHVALVSWHWIHQVAAPCSVICGSGMTCQWIRRWQHPAMWQVALGWHVMEFAQTSAMLEFYIWLRFWPYHRSRHVILHQSAKFYPNRTTISRKKWRRVDFQDGGLSHLGFLGSNNGFFESK